MNKMIVITLSVAFTVVWPRPVNTYGDEFDHIDIDEILSSQRLTDNYIHCFKTGQKCTPDGVKIREILPEALKTQCAKCTPVQKEKTLKIVEWTVGNRPEAFLEIESIFDPEHQYRTGSEDELKARNIVLPPLKQ